MGDFEEQPFALGKDWTPKSRGLIAGDLKLFRQEPNDGFQRNAVRGEVDAFERCVVWEAVGLGQDATDMEMCSRVRVFGCPKVVVAENPLLSLGV